MVVETSTSTEALRRAVEEKFRGMNPGLWDRWYRLDRLHERRGFLWQKKRTLCEICGDKSVAHYSPVIAQTRAERDCTPVFERLGDQWGTIREIYGTQCESCGDTQVVVDGDPDPFF
jgi:hypothetical protein